MSEPIVTSISLDRDTISAISGKNTATISFKFDIPVVEYSIDVTGTSHTSGILAGSGIKNVNTAKTKTVNQAKLLTVQQAREFLADTIINDFVDSTELYGAGSNRINVYGKSLDGTWSTYDQN